MLRFYVLSAVQVRSFVEAHFEVNLDETSDAEQLAQVEQKIESLPADLREVLVRRLVSGQSSEEIAATLGVSPYVVHVKFARAIRLLSTQLGVRPRGELASDLRSVPEADAGAITASKKENTPAGSIPSTISSSRRPSGPSALLYTAEYSNEGDVQSEPSQNAEGIVASSPPRFFHILGLLLTMAVVAVLSALIVAWRFGDLLTHSKTLVLAIVIAGCVYSFFYASRVAPKLHRG